MEGIKKEIKEELTIEFEKKIDEKIEENNITIRNEIKKVEDNNNQHYKELEKSIQDLRENLVSKNTIENAVKAIEEATDKNIKQEEKLSYLLAKFDGELLGDLMTYASFFKTALGKLLVSGLIFLGSIIVMFLASIVSPKINTLISENTRTFLAGNGIVTIVLSVLARNPKRKGGDKSE